VHINNKSNIELASEWLVTGTQAQLVENEEYVIGKFTKTSSNNHMSRAYRSTIASIRQSFDIEVRHRGVVELVPITSLTILMIKSKKKKREKSGSEEKFIAKLEQCRHH
jgi:hypothetical protein